MKIMALNIRNPETERLAETLARLTGETKTQAVTQALRDRLEQVRRRRSGRPVHDPVDADRSRGGLPVAVSIGR